MSDQDLLTVEQAAHEAHCDPRTIRRAIERDLVASHIGDPDATVKSWRIRRADFDTWLEQRSNRNRRRDSGRAEAIAPVIAMSRPPRRRGRSAGRVTVDSGMGRP